MTKSSPSAREKGKTGPLWLLGKAQESRPIAIVLLAGTIVLVALIAATVAAALDRRAADIAAARREMITTDTLLAEDTARSLQSVQLVLSSIADWIASQGITTAEQYEAQMAGRDTHDLLAQKIAGVPQIDAVTMINTRGKLINFSRTWPIPDVDVADRDYFLALRDNPTDKPFLSVPVENRGSGTWTIYLARRITGPSGNFVGLVLGAILLDHFEDLYSSLPLTTGAAIALWRNDGTLLARHPPSPVGQKLPVEAIEAPAGEGIFTSSFSVGRREPILRLIASKRVAGYPLLVNVTRPMSEVLSPWRRQSVFIVAAGLLCMAAVTAIMAALIRQFLAYEHVAAAVADRERAIMDREKVEQQLLQAQKLEAVGQLTAGIAHDFNNLLTVILGGAATAQKFAGDHPRLNRSLGNIRLAAERAASLTAQLLAFARKQPLRPEVLPVAAHVEAAASLLERSIGAGIRVETEIAPDIWHITADPSQLELALLNVGLNARDAMPNGGLIRFEARNIVLPDDDGVPQQYVSISVRDTGTGIPPEIRDRVLEPFFTTKEIGKGSGLGLSQAFGFATQSGGRMRIESEPGSGTMIVFKLPAVVAAAAEVQQASAPVPTDVTWSGRVLMVEDDPAIGEMVGETLREAGYDVTLAITAPDALLAMGRDPAFDLVFSDIMMPGGMNGVELARAIRQAHPSLPILLATGYSEAASNRSAREFPLMTKPYDIGELQARLAAMILEAKGA
ncbi:Signal transduction histidine kinase regulating C4-dicarboxylate transport system [Faunimonas pinastri]|uniref:histidine kinase n=1 Tax=Faunimonas pinastri TaxID=1855383 RepID=A0A1H9JEU1_9HYPH|nr:hybrid sensor histidine kinase/response regulator [Faunimonas pinastri]SEQ85313.1 Signal transduction histidine kinase regulating C4-dicarboxylate transport system [Faunimonas pinastri]